MWIDMVHVTNWIDTGPLQWTELSIWVDAIYCERSSESSFKLFLHIFCADWNYLEHGPWLRTYFACSLMRKKMAGCSTCERQTQHDS